MNPMLNLGSSKLELNTLFIQPSRFCTRECKNCYIRSHQGGEESYHVPVEVWDDLFREVFSRENISVNQLTFSLDNLHKEPAKKEYMMRVFESLIVNRAMNPSNEYEVHITAHSLATLGEYIIALGNKFNINALNYIDMLSLSSITTNDILALAKLKKLQPNLSFCYNHMRPQKIDWDKQVKFFNTIGGLVDHIYMLITKSPMGINKSILQEEADNQRLNTDIAYIETIKSRVTHNVREKIVVDGCLQDVKQYTRTGFGCSSNVSRFQVWPDGSVTGCPYAFRGGPKTARTSQDILANIRQARKQYDFNKICSLPKAYISVTGRTKNSESQIQNRRHIFPIID